MKRSPTSYNTMSVKFSRPDAALRRRRQDALLLGNEIIAFWSAQHAQCSRYLRIGAGNWTADEQRLLQTLRDEAAENRASVRIPDEQMRALEAIARKFLKNTVRAPSQDSAVRIMTPAQELTAAHRGRWHGGYGAIRTPGHSSRDFGTIIHDRLDGKGVYVFCFNADWRDVRQALGLARDQKPLSPAERRKTAQLRKEVARQAAEEEQRRRALALSIWKAGASLEASNG